MASITLIGKRVIKFVFSNFYTKPKSLIRLMLNPSSIRGTNYYPEKEEKSNFSIFWDQVLNIIKYSDIDFDKLPNQFVLKTTHGGGGGGVVICKDKASFNIDKAKSILERSYKQDIYTSLKEWPYKNVKRRIIAEQLLGNNRNSLNDYKFFCFNGEVKLCQVISGRDSTMTIDFYDKEWNHMPFHEPKSYPFSSVGHNKPTNYDKMWELASILSDNIPFLRVDFYSIGDQIYFGELTFFPTSGFGGFTPSKWDKKLGDLIKLPKID